MLASKEGVLEVRLTARQGQATLDTVAKPVQNFLLFDYEVIRGTAWSYHRYPLPATHYPLATTCYPLRFQALSCD